MSRTFRNRPPKYFRRVKTYGTQKMLDNAYQALRDEGFEPNNRLKSFKLPTYYNDKRSGYYQQVPKKLW